MDEEEVGPALRFEARKHLPFDPQGMIIDFQVIGRYPSERRLDVLLAAVSESHLERHVAPLRSVGLEADIVDATPLALTNAVAAGLEPTRDGHVVLDVGHQSSTLSIYLRGEAYFSRRLAFGGHSITRAISDAGRIPFDEAEEWKLAAGGPEPTHVLKWDSAEMHAVVEALRRELVDELRRSFVFYQTQGSLPDPLVLYLCGGTAQLPLLAERIGELLGSAVEVFEPPGNRAAPANARGGPQYAQAFGLSLRMR
jgi:general secretion pathway protein L